MTATDTDRQLYTVQMFCWRNSIGKTLFYELVRTGAIQVVHVGRRALVPAVSEAAWHAKILPATVPIPTPISKLRTPVNHGEHQRPKIRYRPLKNSTERTKANNGG